jgi:hypothetical protein
VPKFWRGKRQADLEDRLRAFRREPGEQFVEEMSARVVDSTPRRQRLRLGVAVAVAILVAVPFLAFGGVSVAAHSLQATVRSLTGSQSVSSIGGSQSGKGGDNSSAHHEYCPPKEKSDRCDPPPPHCDKGQHLSDGKCRDDHGGNGGNGGGNGGHDDHNGNGGANGGGGHGKGR